MRTKTLGVALVILGTAALVLGVVGYNRQTTILDVGGFKATATERKTVPLAPVVGAIALVGGIVLLGSARFRHE